MGEPVKIVDLAKNLIELSNSSSEIIFTGLRPGEKLYEELLIEGILLIQFILKYLKLMKT